MNDPQNDPDDHPLRTITDRMREKKEEIRTYLHLITNLEVNIIQDQIGTRLEVLKSMREIGKIQL